MSQREIPMQDEPEIEAASFYDMRDACKDARVRWAARFRTVRAETERRAAPLSSEDQSVQSMPDASPIKWHRAHTTWFVEHFLIGLHALGYRGFDERFAFLFNSYCVQAGPRHGRLIEFGSGSSTTIRILLGDLPDLTVYVPIDVSAELLAAEADALRRDFSRLKVRPVVGDFMRRFPFPLDAAGRPRVGFFPGSTIGNFDKPQAAAFLAHARDMLGVGSSFILGVDLAKDEGIHAAYDDVAGVTTRFSLNMLARINRKIGANIVTPTLRPPRLFQHAAFSD